jgi:phage regulator Rha-like protein
MFHFLTNLMSFGTLIVSFIPMTAEQKKEQKNRLLKAKIAVALHDELGRVPKQEEIEQVFLMARVMYKAVLGLHFKRKEQKKSGQLAIF